MSERIEKLSKRPNQTRFRYIGLFHLREGIVTEKPFTQESFVTKSLWVERKHLSLTSGKVTLPRGKLECRSCYAETSRNQTLVVDLGAVLPGRASGCVGCRRRENIRITGFSRSRRNLSRWKAIIVHWPAWKALSLESLLERRLSLEKVYWVLIGSQNVYP